MMLLEQHPFVFTSILRLHFILVFPEKSQVCLTFSFVLRFSFSSFGQALEPVVGLLG